MTAYHGTTAPLPPGVVHLTNLVPEADAHAILAALDISDNRDDRGRARTTAKRPTTPRTRGGAIRVQKGGGGDAGASRRVFVEALLLAQCVAYGIKGSMAPHVDASVTRSKPLVVLSFGLTASFAGALKAAAPVRRRRAARRGDDAARRRRHYCRHGGAKRPRVAHVLRATARERGDDGALDGAAALFDDDSDDGEGDYAVLLFYQRGRTATPSAWRRRRPAAL